MSTARGIKSWPFMRHPLRLQIYIVGLAVATFVLFGWLLYRDLPTFDNLGTLALLLLCGAVVAETSRGFLRKLTSGFIQELNSIWKLPVILLLPPALAFIASSFLILLWGQSVRRQAELHRRVFNITAVGISDMIASWFFHSVVGSHPSLPVWFGCALLAATVARVSNYLALAVVVLMTRSGALHQLLDREALMYTAVEVCTGLIVTLLAVQSVPLVILAVLPVILLHRSLLHEQLQHMSRTDSKTAVLNAGAWEHDAELELSRAKKSGESTSVLICDIDHFKLVNDEHGHLAGDAALRAVAQRLQALLRQGDILGRFGGEEFVILLSGIGADNARSIGERLRRSVAADPIALENGGGSIRLTVSLGVATLERSDGNLPEVLAAADEALYAAKRSGRNQVVTAKSLRPAAERTASPEDELGHEQVEGESVDDTIQPGDPRLATTDDLPDVAESRRTQG